MAKKSASQGRDYRIPEAERRELDVRNNQGEDHSQSADMSVPGNRWHDHCTEIDALNTQVRNSW